MTKRNHSAIESCRSMQFLYVINLPVQQFRFIFPMKMESNRWKPENTCRPVVSNTLWQCHLCRMFSRLKCTCKFNHLKSLACMWAQFNIFHRKTSLGFLKNEMAEIPENVYAPQTFMNHGKRSWEGGNVFQQLFSSVFLEKV